MPDIMLVVTLLTSGKLKQSERQDLSIYRAMGLPCTALRRSFSLRFLQVSLVGSDRLARCGHGPDGADADVWHEQLQLPAGVGRPYCSPFLPAWLAERSSVRGLPN